MAKKISAQEKFNEYFLNIYQDRWSSLNEALKAPDLKIAHTLNLAHAFRPGLSQIDGLPKGFFEMAPDQDYRAIREVRIDGSSIYYLMDLASAIAALSLNIEPEDKVLDMCAAPGGKSLILARSIGPTGQMVCNEPSGPRRERLRKVIAEYLPEEVKQRIRVSSSDATLIGLKFPEEFDKILLDAPCSGEKHLVQSSQEISKWSAKRSSRLSGMQYSMLCSALLSLKVNGVLLYSTCSISPLENDKVIEKFLTKKNDYIELATNDLNLPSFVEKTEFGFSIFPDTANGHGPIYFTRLRKKQRDVSAYSNKKSK